MKHFYYNIVKSNRRVYGGLNETAKIYGIKKGRLIYLTSVKWCTASTCGEKSEVFQKLVSEGYIAKKWLKSSESSWSSGGYFSGEVINHFTIERI